MNIQWTLALRYLWGRKLRTVLTTLAVVFGVTVLFGLESILPAMLQALRQNMLASAGKVDLTVSTTANGVFDAAYLEQLRGVAGIGRATGALQQPLILPAALTKTAAPAPGGFSKPGITMAALNLIVVGLDPATAQDVRAYPIVEGRFLTEGDAQAIVLPENLAVKLELAIGDVLVLPAAKGTADFEVVGLLTARPVPGAADEVYVPLAAAQALFNHPGRLNVMEAIFTPDADRAQVESAVLAKMGAGFKVGALEYGSELFAALEMGQFAFIMFGVMALAMGAFIILNTFRTIVAERRRDLGMLRAVGASRQTIIGLIVTEGLIQSVVGTVIGLIVGYGLAAVMMWVVNPIIQNFMHFSMGMPIVTPANVALSCALGVSITLLGGLLPARAAANVTPLEALRPQSAAGYERTARKRSLWGAGLLLLAALTLFTGNLGLAGLGTLLFLAGLVLVAPALVAPVARTFGRLLGLIFAREGQIAEGNITRQPGRAAITASAMMFGFATVIALGGMLSSVSDGFMRYLEISLGSDFIFMPSSFILGGGNVGAGPELVNAIRSTAGVAGVTTLRQGTTTINGGQLQLVGIDPATYPAIAGLEFSVGESAEAFAALGRERALIVNGIFSMQNGVKIGDVLTLQTPGGAQAYRVVGVGMDYLNAKLATAYISQENLERDFQQTADLLLMAELTAGADAMTTRRALQALANEYPAFTLLDWASFRETQVQTFNSAMSMLYVVMVAFSLPALIAMINTLAINVIERTREIGMLRAVGSTRKQIRRMIQAESLLLAALGTACGILAGLWLSYVLVQALNASGFMLDYYFPYAGILGAIAVGLLFGVLAATIPARQAARMDIVAALRYE